MIVIFNWTTEFVCCVGIAMGVTWLFYKNWFLSTARYIALYLIFFCLILLEQNLYWSTFFIENPHWVLVTDPLALLLGPMLLFYHFDCNISARKKWLHYVPSIIVILIYLPIYSLATADKVEFVKRTIWQGNGINALNFILFRILLALQILYYGYVIQGKRKYDWSFEGLISAKGSLEQLLLGLFFIYGGLRAIWLFFILLTKYQHIYFLDNTIRMTIAFSILYFFIKVFGKIRLDQNSSYERSLMGNKDVILLKDRLNKLMQNGQPYLSKNLKMHDIASALNISEHKLSQLLNVHLGINFFEYVNQYRIDRAKVLLKDPNYQKYTIETIAGECGFNSKSSFNEAFKKREGTTPSIFKKPKNTTLTATSTVIKISRF